MFQPVTPFYVRRVKKDSEGAVLRDSEGAVITDDNDTGIAMQSGVFQTPNPEFDPAAAAEDPNYKVEPTFPKVCLQVAWEVDNWPALQSEFAEELTNEGLVGKSWLDEDEDEEE